MSEEPKPQPDDAGRHTGEHTGDQAARRAAVRLHLRFGWAAIAVFVALGTLLEVLHGLKIGWYLDVHHATRRFLWTLAHAHGVLIGVMNVAFALTLRATTLRPGRRRLASRGLIAANVLMPAGFFLGGIDTHGGDPGLATPIFVPIGAALLLVAVVVIALEVGSPGDD